MVFAKDVSRTQLDVSSPERIKRFLKSNSSMKFAMVFDGYLLSSSNSGVPLGEFVTSALLSLDYIEFESPGFVFIYPLDDEVAVVIKKDGDYLVDEVVPAGHWRLTAFHSDAAALPIITTAAFAGDLQDPKSILPYDQGREVVLFEHDLLRCGNPIGELQPASHFTQGRVGNRVWLLLAGAVVAAIAVYLGWFKQPPPEPPIDHYAEYRQEMTKQPLAGSLRQAVEVLINASGLDAWNVDKVIVVPGQITVTLGAVADGSPIKEAQLFAKKHGYDVDFIGDTVVIRIQTPIQSGNPNVIYDVIGNSIAVRDAIAPNFTLAVRFGGFIDKPRYSSVDLHITGDAVLLDSLLDIAQYLDDRPVLLDKIELSRPADGIEFLYSVDIKSRIVGEVRRNG